MRDLNEYLRELDEKVTLTEFKHDEAAREVGACSREVATLDYLAEAHGRAVGFRQGVQAGWAYGTHHGRVWSFIAGSMTSAAVASVLFWLAG